ncbi:endonuclease/exonuclease/phosphatase family metal-dependent hydrolase [Parabacteroides sp. PF5-5]|uniref:endonuclease/exonuclease/phosphatase family protein n=1 Tax=unclassified Parabacteroides TaxID=2649774 RepID=UPI0024745398|nr:MULTISPECIES: endonuclease/exonuclease/phosphatase family protein [unclassified Parabacteroides]MDH6306596.1 endonuclease/exonuclease/phosphatase family metal-dependent hydrolase [Parabacteroides sp. PH5-39]MDH6317563.1 endonuclease/exonuclease/phosphatase family metal-dependent hydrolase [Parabacteroides sp. PF5-13]MDH6321307.1 endonuclease/exonuclease/phosphatase family metal-dependent hydrolase [Parabacteroides sp. PH5-13]MDH6325039.1 endonuclease/exonuclease/phosphatase family metal-depe
MPYYHPIRKIADTEERLRVVERLLLLRRQLDREIPQKTAEESLLLATWNIREFGNNRRTESLYYIAEILSRFNLIAIQEVSSNMSGLEKVMNILGHGWDYIVTDSTEGSAGGSERIAFVYDTNKVFFRKMAGEIVLPQDKLIQGEYQYARTPFCVALQAGWFKFHLAMVHIYYGKSSGVDPRRVAEIDSIAKFLTKRSKKEDTSYILLGDFNIPKCGDETMLALEKNGFFIPDCIKEHPTDLGNTKHYDQIAFNLKLDKAMTVFSKKEQKAGAFNFTESVYTPDDVSIYRKYFDPKYTVGKTDKEVEKYYMSKWRTFQMSDHLPLWVELKVDFSNQYLERIKKETK